MTHDLRVQVASVLDPDAMHKINLGECGYEIQQRTLRALIKADAIIALVRADAFERAAEHCEKVADAFGPNHDASAAFAANAIRALATSKEVKP